MSEPIDTVEMVNESTTPVLTMLLVDAADVPIPGSALTSLRLTYYQEYTTEVINARSLQNVLQQHGVTIDEAGLLTWNLAVQDTVIVDDALEVEPHIARFDFTYPSSQQGRKLVRIPVRNLALV